MRAPFPPINMALHVSRYVVYIYLCGSDVFTFEVVINDIVPTSVRHHIHTGIMLSVLIGLINGIMIGHGMISLSLASPRVVARLERS